MVRNYVPKTRFFEPTRIHKIAKDVVSDCREDRERALETFKYFKTIVDSTPDDDKAKTEMIHALGLSQDANDKIVKVLDMMIKMTQTERKIDADKVVPLEEISFEELRKAQKNG